MNKLNLSILLISWLIYSSSACAQQSSMGTDFWLGFIDQFDNGVQTRLWISSDVAASGTVVVPLQFWSQAFTVAANATTIVTIPTATVYVGNSEVITGRGVHITSNNPVSVIASTTTAVRSETAHIIPTPLLGTEYYAASYAPGGFNFTSEFMVVATTNNTAVNITPSAPTSGGKPANVPFTVTLSAGQVYQVQASNSGSKDMTGSKIAVSPSNPCSKIAVFAGMTDAYIPTGCQFADPLYEEMYPVNSWGTDYVVPPFFSATSQARIIASQNTTSVSVDGGSPFILNAGQFNEQSFNGSSHCITADKPIAVAHYMKGSDCSGGTPNKGDPSMIVLNSNNRRINKYVFTPFDDNGSIANRYVNVVMQTPYTGQLQLDGAAVGSGLFTASPCSGYSYITLSLTNAFHTLFADSGFAGYLYGYGGGDESFANSLGYGSNGTIIPPDITSALNYCVNGIPVILTATVVGGTWTGTGITNGSTGAFNPAIAGTGNHQIIYTISGCGGADTVTIAVNSAPAVSLGNDTNFCAGNNILLNAGNVGSAYLWQDSSTAQTLTASSAGQYFVVVTDTNGCSASDTINIIVNNAPVVSLGNDTSFCAGNNLILNAGNAGSTYLWKDGSTAQTDTTSSAGQYFVVVTNANGCSASDTINIIVNNAPVVSLGNDTSFCAGNNLILNAGNAGSIYLWKDSSTAQTDTASTTGQYFVVVTTNGCSASDTINITVNSAPAVSLGNDTGFCSGNNLILNAGNAGSTYLWQNGSTTQTLTASTAGQYSVVVTNTNGCSAGDTIQILVSANPVANAGNDVTILSGEPVTLNGTGGGTYQWSPSAGLSCNNCAGTLANPIQTTTYVLTVTDNKGCAGTDTVTVTIDLREVKYVPNMFSPNDDGKNDKLYFYGIGIKWFKLIIYDRWGKKVIELSDISSGWDGTFRGEALNPAVFVYFLKGEFVSGKQFEEKGNITLVR